ncbi:hypothetical protein [Aeoliella mucimassa]|nr:hypothetical protein [Aeoliella mucimassa]
MVYSERCTKHSLYLDDAGTGNSHFWLSMIQAYEIVGGERYV